MSTRPTPPRAGASNGSRFGLRPLPKRDAEAYNLLDGLAFSGAARALRVG